jgi:hypothetical protein
MSNKIGRPKVLKRDAKAVLIGTRLSPPAAKEAEQAIAASSQDKSKWLREAISEKVERQKRQEFIASICKDLQPGEGPKEIGATLTADGLPPSTGIFFFGSETDWPGHYRPTDSYNLSIYPLHRAKLKLSGRSGLLSVTSIQLCLTASPPAYHVWFDVPEN